MKISKLKRSVISLIIGIGLVLAQSGLAFATSKSVRDLPFYSQTPYINLCWATTASMITSFFKGDELDRKIDIARIYTGSQTNFNKAGSLLAVQEGISYYMGYRFGSIYQKPLSYKAIKYQINENGPVVVRYYYGDDKHVGHIVVITGYYEDNKTKAVIYFDPWKAKVQTMDYQRLVHNTTENWTWDQSLFYR
jgi:hypothetical protein